MAKVTDQDRRDLSKALSYANWSALGLIIPLIGWFLAGTSLSFIKTIPVTSETSARIKQVKRAAWLGIIVSSFAVAAWGGFYRYNQYQNEKEVASVRAFAEEQSKKEQEAQSLLKDQERNTQKALGICLNDAYTSYKNGWSAESTRLGMSDNTLPQAYAENWESRLKEFKDECYKKSEAGLFKNLVCLNSTTLSGCFYNSQ